MITDARRIGPDTGRTLPPIKSPLVMNRSETGNYPWSDLLQKGRRAAEERPRGMSNPGRFDYEAWPVMTKVKGIGAAGTSIPSGVSRLELPQSKGALHPFAAIINYPGKEWARRWVSRGQMTPAAALIVSATRKRVEQGRYWQV